MTLEPSAAPRSSGRRRRAVTLGLIGGGVAAGAIFATALGANASTSSTTSSTVPSRQTAGYAAPAGSTTRSGAAGALKNHGAAPVRSDEKALSASDTAKLKAAALKAVPGGTVYRVETDAGDGTYEAHMTKANGSEVTVKFDKSFAVTKVEQGMGAGDPAPPTH
jgi:hypothetical protein